MLTFVCVGSGPSLTREDCRYVASRRNSEIKVIAINDCYHLIPEADFIYATDYKWWNWKPLYGTSKNNFEEARKICEGKLVTTDSVAKVKFPDITYLEGKHSKGFSRVPNLLHWGYNSGYAAINLALINGAKRIVLLGYDMRIHTKSSDQENGTLGLNHWFGHHPDKVVSSYARWIPWYEEGAKLLKEWDIEVKNCTKGSALTCFPMAELEKIL